jgi:hypothetical protein
MKVGQPERPGTGAEEEQVEPVAAEVRLRRRERLGRAALAGGPAERRANITRNRGRVSPVVPKMLTLTTVLLAASVLLMAGMVAGLGTLAVVARRALDETPRLED